MSPRAKHLEKSPAPQSKKTKPKVGAGTTAESKRIDWVYRSGVAAHEVPVAALPVPLPLSTGAEPTAPRPTARPSVGAAGADMLLLPVSLSLMMILAPLSWISGSRRRT